MCLFTKSLRATTPPLVLAWGSLTALYIWAGFLPDEYLIYVRGITTPQAYPVKMILIESGISSVAFAIVAWGLSSHSWSRVAKFLVGTVIVGSVGVFAGMGAMHAPRHYIYFSLGMLLLAFVSLLGTLFWIALGIMYKVSHADSGQTGS
ncbi:hypothetical protein [Collimonas pratensis]|uniref:hypothetical protein n=1 Tax=Collimonas pratensis TaxID=279113 RepID=UPI000B223CAB|nr:hypothetical protein [Collimonas pratensis]NKI70054.1 hypothetical protein [Collimonas pratensis]